MAFELYDGPRGTIKLIKKEDKRYVEFTCKQCQDVIHVPVTLTQLNTWAAGAMIQHAFPELSADVRELFISGICGPCFDKLFREV